MIFPFPFSFIPFVSLYGSLHTNLFSITTFMKNDQKANRDGVRKSLLPSSIFMADFPDIPLGSFRCFLTLLLLFFIYILCFLFCIWINLIPYTCTSKSFQDNWLCGCEICNACSTVVELHTPYLLSWCINVQIVECKSVFLDVHGSSAVMQSHVMRRIQRRLSRLMVYSFVISARLVCIYTWAELSCRRHGEGCCYVLTARLMTL